MNPVDWRGMNRAKAGLAGLLAIQVPIQHARLGPEWGWSDADMNPLRKDAPFPPPLPVDKGGYQPNAPAAIDRWPLVAVTGGTTRVKRTELTEAGDASYDTTHRLRTFVWCRAKGPTLTERVRDDYVSLLIYTMLDAQGFAVDGAPALIVEDTISATYSEIAKPVNGDRWVAAGQIDCDVRVEEAVIRPPVGTVSAVTLTADAAGMVLLDGELVPMHPALGD